MSTRSLETIFFQKLIILYSIYLGEVGGGVNICAMHVWRSEQFGRLNTLDYEHSMDETGQNWHIYELSL